MNKFIIPRSKELRLETLRKDLEKYNENVNKCNISMIDSLSFIIGSEMGFLRHTELTDGQRSQLKNLEEEHYKIYSNKVRKCQCVKKLDR